MLKVGDQVVVNNCLVNYSNAKQVGRFRGKIVQISNHSVEPLYQIKYDSSTPWHYGWRYAEDLLRIVTICAGVF
jgi:hypothetical protein